MTSTERALHLITQRFLSTGSASPDEDLRRDYGADSLDIVELSMSLENEFGICITQRQEDEWQTVQDVLNTLQEHGVGDP